MKNSLSFPYSRLWLRLGSASLLLRAVIASAAPALAESPFEWRPVDSASVAVIEAAASATKSEPLVAKQTRPDQKSNLSLSLRQPNYVSSRVAVDGTPLRHAHDTAGPRNKAFGQRFASWLQGLQMLLSHVPIMMFLAALALQLHALQRRKPYYPRTAEAMLIAGTIVAIVAALVASLAGDLHVIDPNPALLLHRWPETVIAVTGLPLMYLLVRTRRVEAPRRRRYLAWAALLAGLIAVQGMVGGTFIHGGHNDSAS